MCSYNEICANGQGNGPSYGIKMSQDQWVSFAPSDGGKNMLQIGTWTSTTSTAEVCTTIYERHYPSTPRAAWEANHEAARQDAMEWRTYGYCCAGISTKNAFWWRAEFFDEYLARLIFDGNLLNNICFHVYTYHKNNHNFRHTYTETYSANR